MMPYETGDYQELKAFEKVIDWGIYVGMPGYCKAVLQLQIRHANWPSGWVWVGARKARDKLGVSDEHWLGALDFLATNRFYKAWGWAKTRGHPALAFQLDLGVPEGKVDIPEKPQRKPYHSNSGKVNPLTLPLFILNLTIVLGQPYHWDDIKTCTTLKNPKESRDSFSQDTKSKSSLLRGLCDEFKEFEVSLRSDWDFYVDKSKQNPDEVYSKLKKKALEGSYKPAD